MQPERNADILAHPTAFNADALAHAISGDYPGNPAIAEIIKTVFGKTVRDIQDRHPLSAHRSLKNARAQIERGTAQVAAYIAALEKIIHVTDVIADHKNEFFEGGAISQTASATAIAMAMGLKHPTTEIWDNDLTYGALARLRVVTKLSDYVEHQLKAGNLKTRFNIHTGQNETIFIGLLHINMVLQQAVRDATLTKDAQAYVMSPAYKDAQSAFNIHTMFNWPATALTAKNNHAAEQWAGTLQIRHQDRPTLKPTS